MAGQYLSAWAVKYDTPIHIDIVRVQNQKTKKTFFRARSNAWLVELGKSEGIPKAHGEYSHYASLYREALIANTPTYRFLCLFKILESTTTRHGRLAIEAKTKGEPLPKRAKDKVPTSIESAGDFLRLAYPYPRVLEWDDIAKGQVFVPQAAGKSFTDVIDNFLRSIRDKLAHGIMDSGELGISIDRADHSLMVEQWLPLLRCMARIRLRNDFGNSAEASILFEEI